ncbi:MAG: hypothetical protein M3Q79_03220 [bacterium]|nr:hypothetical protein [bacterium]
MSENDTPVALPRGSVYLEERRKHLEIEITDSVPRAHEIGKVDDWLQTGRCVGGLAVCKTCETVGQSPCPSSLNARVRIINKVFALSDTDLEKLALQVHLNNVDFDT